MLVSYIGFFNAPRDRCRAMELERSIEQVVEQVVVMQIKVHWLRVVRLFC